MMLVAKVPIKKTPMTTIKVELTEAEANTLANLIDMAVRANGVRVAADAVALIQKLQDAAKPQESEQ